MDFEELLAEEKKIAEGLKKEVDALTKKQKIIDNGLKTAEADLEAFQVSGFSMATTGCLCTKVFWFCFIISKLSFMFF